jgi:type VI secretion system protein ImpA
MSAMSDVGAIAGDIETWLRPLADADGPCGADLEYDNEFLALAQAAAGKPETQFSAAEPPDWSAVVAGAASLLGRTRDLRLAVYWARGVVHEAGFDAVAPALSLVAGLVEHFWDAVHPLPDPDDGDSYARVNALSVLRESEGLLGDLRGVAVVRERSVGEVTLRQVELAAGLARAHAGEAEPARETIAQMLGAAVSKMPELRARAADAAATAAQLARRVADRLESDAPDLTPLVRLLAAVPSLMPAEAEAEGEADATGEPHAALAAAPNAAPRGLSGSVATRDDAIRALDMVCEYLERTEPSNPAPLFLRRARQLVNHNFLQLMKVLAPDALSEVARVVGVDPESVETPDGT